jgi:hypothetical protein
MASLGYFWEVPNTMTDLETRAREIVATLRGIIMCKEDTDAVADIIEDLLSERTWQPIENAPKDGTYILSFDANSNYPDDVEETIWIAYWDRDCWRIALDGQSVNPTNWMPLPTMKLGEK